LFSAFALLLAKPTMNITTFGGLLALLPLVLGSGQALAETTTFTNAAGIILADGAAPTPAAPYPSGINVSGMSGLVHKVTVQLTGLSHTFPDDLDMLLVAPGGTQALILSDVGGGTDVGGITLLLDDAAASALPDATVLSSGTFQPTNQVTGDAFPAPAPVAGSGSSLSAFQGIAPNGVWNLYIVDDANNDAGTLSAWSLTLTTAVPAVAGELVISEFRVRGPNGANDEFIEIHNATDAGHIVASIDGSAGYAVRASDGTTRFIIPNGTTIPARGHYLGVNSVGYGLAAYPAGNGTTATGNITYTTDIPDNAGIALFRSAIQGGFTLANRLDAAGSTAEANNLYKEGPGYPALTPFSIDYSFQRNLLGGVIKDSGSNAGDFIFVDSNGTSAGAGQRLGAPGPQNLSSPVRLRRGPSLVRQLLNPALPVGTPPNRVRDFTSDPPNNSTFGTLDVRRKFTNLTGANLTRLRFRIVDLSTFPAPSGIADLRPRTSTAVVVSVPGPVSGTVNVVVQGTTLEQPPSQQNGGGLNSTMSVGTITLAAPLAPGASVYVRFLFGIQQTGSIRFAMVPETLPAAATGVWIVSGSTESQVVDVETLPAFSIVGVGRAAPNVLIDHLCAPGVIYRLQSSTTLGSWSDIGADFAGSGNLESFLHAGASGPARRFYRLRDVP
jgi:subtilisin-like proprotein convertase family protein